ncbi:MAG: hypothetical protein Q9225_003458 [Loekoesia sp. 1 TL-2023]
MTSTWTYHSFHGYLDRRSAHVAWYRALTDAERSSHGLIDPGTHHWSGAYPNAETVDVVLHSRPRMTWRMLVEGIRGAAMLLRDEKEYEFQVMQDWADGEVRVEVTVGSGKVTMRRERTVERRPADHSLPGVANLTLPDPFIWHHDPMVSTWEFYDYKGYLSRRSATLAWNRVFDEAVDDHDFDSLIGTRMKRWSATVPDEGTVDVILVPGREMTWKMLAEGIRGAERVIPSGVEFKFFISTEGVQKVIGHGETIRRKSSISREKLEARDTRLALPAGSSAGSAHVTNLTISDPFIWRPEGMTSIWEFYNYHGRLNYALAFLIWNDALNEAIAQGALPITHRTTWSRKLHSETADLDLIPLQGMTWPMLVEGYGGAAVVNYESKEYQFIVLAEGGEGEVGYGRLTMRKNLRSERKLDARDAEEKSNLGLLMNSTAHPPQAGTASVGTLNAMDDRRKSTLALPIITCPSVSVSAHFRDPFIWHENSMISTWEFYGFSSRGAIAPGIAMSAWRLAYNDARQRTQAGYGSQQLGTQTRTWSTAGLHPRTTVDLVLVPREGMTWAMLAEGFQGASILICGDRRQFQFIVMAEGIHGEVAYGQTTMRENTASGKALSARGSKNPGLTLGAKPSAQLSKANIAAVSVRDPFIWHTEDMVTTWEFYGYRGHLDRHICEELWIEFFEEALVHLAQGAGDSRLGTQPKHWAMRSRDGMVDLVLIPREEMTWQMMLEGPWGAGKVCPAAKEFQFVVVAAGVEDEVGLGQITVRRGTVAAA